MLLGLDPVLGPDLLHALAAMGHGDRIALVDANYPATRGRRLIHLPGLSTPRVLQAVLSVFPIIDVASWQIFAVKIIAVLVATTLIGVGIYRTGRRARPA